MKIKKLSEGVNVQPMLWALQSHPELWNQNTARTESPASPHHGLSDIWARYAENPAEAGPHESIWYPCADLLPVRELAYPLMAAFHGDRLGGVLITKIPAGAECKPHTDPGWHARYYQKFAVQIASAPGQRFCFEGEDLETRPGDVFWFDNAHTHWVTNPTPYERITLIVCIKTDWRP
jgi:quercetin dioxygenase-like cupin family protein